MGGYALFRAKEWECKAMHSWGLNIFAEKLVYEEVFVS